MADKTRYILYARKSTDEKERQVRSIEEQLDEMRETARQKNLTVIAEIVEKKSAKAPGRPEFAKMIEKIEAGEADGILAWHADRLARNSIDGGRLIYLFDIRKLQRLQFFGSFVENSPQGKMMLNAEFGFSKYYVDSLSENVKRGHRNKVGRGEVPCIAPLGYFNDHRTKTIAVDRDRAPIIKEAFERYSRGTETLDTIRKFFAERGIHTRQTKKSPGGRLVGRTLVSDMLSNPIYYGDFKWSGEVHRGRHEPIIGKDLYDKVQAVMAGRWRWSPHNFPKTPKPYLGLLTCAECGGAISAEIQKGHTYYRCTKKNRDLRCTQPYIREEALDAEVSRLISPFQISPQILDDLKNKLHNEEEHSARGFAADVEKKKAAAIQVAVRLKKQKELLFDELIDPAEARIERAEMLSHLRTIESEIANLEGAGVRWLEPFKEWLNDLGSVKNTALNGSPFEKRTLAKKIFGSNLWLDRKQARGEAVKPWAFFADNYLSHDSAHVFDLARTYFAEIGAPL